jgi:hypothetical protein
VAPDVISEILWSGLLLIRYSVFPMRYLSLNDESLLVEFISTYLDIITGVFNGKAYCRHVDNVVVESASKCGPLRSAMRGSFSRAVSEEIERAGAWPATRDGGADTTHGERG